MSKNLKTLLCCILSLVFVASTIVAVFADSNAFVLKEAESVTDEEVTAEDVSVEEETSKKVEEETSEVVEEETSEVVEEETSEVVEEESSVVVEEESSVVAEEESSVEPEVHVHDYVAVVVTEPTCTEDGVMTYTCACGDTYDEAIAATGHNGVWEIVKPAAIGVEGLKELVCTVCGAVLDSEVIPALEDVSEEASEDVSEEATTDVVVDETTTEAVVDETTTADVVVDETTTADVVVDETTTADVVVDETTTDVVIKIRLGDVNLNGKITAADARLALRISAKLEPTATAEMLYAAEVTGDGKIEAKDARRILRVSAKLDKEADFGKDISVPEQ